MKRKRGRPTGKKFPQPNNIFKGMWNAAFGKIGVSEAMHMVIGCPYREGNSLDRRKREGWDSQVGQIVGKKIAAGESAFFHELAAAVESFTRKEDEPHSIERQLALDYKMDCEFCGQPFTLRGLRAFYDRHGKDKEKIDSSKLSKLYSWARDAEWRKLPRVPEQ
jgi:hypothetical protein